VESTIQYGMRKDAYGAHFTTVDGRVAGRLARGIEGSRSDRVHAGEVELNNITLSSSDAVWAEGIARSDLDGDSLSKDAGQERNRSDEVCELDHFDE
jgi:hypothetical protein